MTGFVLAVLPLVQAAILRFPPSPVRVVAQPGESLVSVRDRVRAIPASNRVHGVEVILPAGIHRLPETLVLDARDSGAEGAPVVWRAVAVPKGRPISSGASLPELEGGQTMPRAAFRPVTDPARLARLDPAARGKVLEADLASLDFKWPKKDILHERFPQPIDVPYVFVNGCRLKLASYPAEDWAEMVKVTRRGTVYGDCGREAAIRFGYVKEADIHGGAFQYGGDRPSVWREPVQIEAFWKFDWRATIIWTESIDPTNRVITMTAPHCFGCGGGNPSPRRWRALNVFEELNLPGRYTVDFERKKMYVYPPEGEFTEAVLCPKALPLVRLEKTHDIVLRGLGFARTRGDGLALKDCTRVAVERCAFRGPSGNAVTGKGLLGCTFRTCDVTETGRGGFDIAGGDRKTLAPGGNLIEDCLFYKWGFDAPLCGRAVQMGGVGNRASHCEIREANGYVAGISGNDSEFSFNVVSNVTWGADDAAAFYKGCNPSMRGNRLEYNFWRDIGADRGHGSAAIYFDDSDGGDLVYGNVFLHAGHPGYGGFGSVFSHGGYSNIVRNCIFIACKRPLGSSPWDQKRWGTFVNGQTRNDPYRMVQKLRKDVDICGDVYLKRYPELKGFLDPQPDAIRWNAAFDNAFVDCPAALPDRKGNLTRPGIVAGRFHTNATDVVFSGDVGFVAAEKGDFRLRADSPIYRRIPNFKPIPFEKIGLLTRER